jgi:homoaconitase/3-isopropylmalate dehydratase large subunit
MTNSPTPRTLFQKLWDAHVVARVDANNVVLYIDRHLVPLLSRTQGIVKRPLTLQRTMSQVCRAIATPARSTPACCSIPRRTTTAVRAALR